MDRHERRRERNEGGIKGKWTDTEGGGKGMSEEYKERGETRNEE